MIPQIAIVGRPNVGKSTLFNRLARRRVSIVHEMAGVTRDRVSVEMEIEGRSWELVDTGGIGIVDRQQLHPDIHAQIEAAILSADLILFLVDARSGLQPLDAMAAERLRREEVPVLLVANKCESEKARQEIGAFYKLGLGDPLPVSAAHGQGIEELEERLEERLPPGDPRRDPALKIAVVGRRNSGKSTFINSLLQEERVLVSALPGTTRDAVDVRFEKDGQEFVIIDTAGLMRRTKLKGAVEFYAQVRALEAIRRCEVAIFLIEAPHGVGQLEKRIAREIVGQHRACVIAVNKWDLAKGRTTCGAFEEYLSKIMPGLGFAPCIFITAKTGKNLADTISLAQSLAHQSRQRVGTGEMNRALEVIRKRHSPPALGGKEPKIFYGTQVKVMPPTLVLFVNRPQLFTATYRRYVENQLRNLLSFPEIPIHVIYRQRLSARE